MPSNEKLHAAKRAKFDEFYTRIEDVEAELIHYIGNDNISPNLFDGKSVYCNCDDPKESAFWRYFNERFDALNLKRLTATSYVGNKPDKDKAWCITRDRDGFRQYTLLGDGDFRSEESIELLKQHDIVVTNEPFSLTREYVAQLLEYKKRFLIVFPQNAITYKEIFPHLRKGDMWLGANHVKEFRVPDDYRAKGVFTGDDGQRYVKMGNVCWCTNLDFKLRHRPLDLIEEYDPAKYPKYDNYDAINVDKVADIPRDYDGVMGVPITFLDKWCPEQFDLLDANDYRLDPATGERVTVIERERERESTGLHPEACARILIRRSR